MPNKFRRKKLSYLIHTALMSSLVAPVIAQAQDDEVEEIVVTGSYIRNSAFAQDTAADTVTGADLLASGTPNMSEYIRELSYVQNVDIINVVLGSQDGPQSSNGASFNLRGLGENSTLTLVDGVRTIDSRINTAFPDIAMERMEMVLDGGSALYGSDAVAGVVNLIPIKEYDGVKFRTFYQRPEDGKMEEMRISALWGKSWDNGLSYVGSAETYLRTPLMWYERGREHNVSRGTSSSGNPGSFKQLEGVPDDLSTLPLRGKSGATLTGPRLLDPSCGTFNQGTPTHGYGPSPLPSGTVHSGNFCTFEYSAQAEVVEHQQEYNVYNNLQWEAADWLRFGFMLNNHARVNEDRGTFASPNPANNRSMLVIPEEHPANPYGFDVAPDLWRMYTHPQAQFLPDLISDDTSRVSRGVYQLNRAKLSAEYDLGNTSWSGYTYYTKQESKTMSDRSGVYSSRLQLALRGEGGASGDQWFNPFGSQDPRSPHYEPGFENSRELNNWLQYNNPNQEYTRKALDVFETMLTGEVFDVPAGAVQMAFGFQWRDLEERTFQEPFEAAGENFIWGVNGEPIAPDEVFNSAVRSVFAEVEIPILDNLAIKGAVRHEQFTDQGMETTTPKISARYELIPGLALRASWGESFLAPTSYQTRAATTNENCADMYSGSDDFSGQLLLGGLACASGNPNLGPEQAEIINVGFTWQAEGRLDGLELSMDYQEIEYTDRIRTLTEDDVTRNQFNSMLRATGQTEGGYDSTPGSPSRLAADAWLGAQPVGGSGGNIFRDADGRVALVLIQSANVAQFDVSLFDLKAAYSFTPGDWGTFNTRLNATVYTDYVFTDKKGNAVDVLGKQNARTNIAPPIPKTKLAWQNNWFRNNHSASMSVSWFSAVDHDAQIVDLYQFDGQFVPPSEIDEDPIIDVRYSYFLEDFFNSAVTLSVGVNNLLDYKPTLTGQIGGFESRLINNFYRQFFVSIDFTPGG
jgi:iron complex outermembrane receptor protein